jgi:hypothetical protein
MHAHTQVWMRECWQKVKVDWLVGVGIGVFGADLAAGAVALDVDALVGKVVADIVGGNVHPVQHQSAVWMSEFRVANAQYGTIQSVPSTTRAISSTSSINIPAFGRNEIKVCSKHPINMLVDLCSLPTNQPTNQPTIHGQLVHKIGL